jgi:hypothetical protein
MDRSLLVLDDNRRIIQADLVLALCFAQGIANLPGFAGIVERDYD